MLTNLKIIVLILLLTAFTIFVMQNTELVTIRLFTIEATMSRVVLLLTTLLAGFLMGFLTAKLTGRKKKKEKLPPPPTPVAPVPPPPAPVEETTQGAEPMS